MRLEIQLEILTAALEKINLVSTQVPNDSNMFVLTNINTVIEGLNDVKIFDQLNPELKNITRIDHFFNFGAKKMSLHRDEFDNISRRISELKHKININIDILKSIIISVTEFTLCVKLVEHDSLKEIADELHILDKIIGQVITHEKIKGGYKFSGFNTGSSWVYIVINSMAAFSLIASVVWSASVIRKKIIEGNISNEYLKQMKLKTETMKEIKEAQSKLLNTYVETEAINIMSEHNLDNTCHEYKNRLIYAINELSKLIFNGVEIQPATVSSEEAKNLFPNYQELDMIESRTKLIERKIT